MRLRYRWLVLGMAVPGLMACRPAAVSLPGPPPLELASAPAVTATGYGRLSLTLRWPARAAQYIPEATSVIDFKVYQAGSDTPLSAQSAARPSSGTTTLTFDRLPAGEVIVTGNAKDSTGKVLSAGSVRITIVANALAQGRLTLYSTEELRLTAMSATNGDPGATVTLFGSGFGASRNATYSVRLGGLAVPGADLVRPDDTTLTFKVPAEATTSVVTLQVEQQATTSAQVFTTIRSWALSPTSADVYVPNGVATFSAVARDWLGQPVADPTLKWTAITQSGSPGRIDASGTFTAGDDLGTHTVRLGNGSAAVEATLTTHAMTLADFGGRLAPLGSVSHPADNPTSAEKIALGKELFFDGRLGSNGAMSCATCHMPGAGWGDGLTRSIGNDGQPLERNSPTILNAGLQSGPFFWDGRAATLEKQAEGVFGAAKELNRTGDSLLAVLEAADYPASFSAVFGAAPSTGAEAMDLTTKAIATFERSVVTQDSAFDRWARGDTAALSLAEKRGLAAFATNRCIDCHSGPLFTDGKFHNISVLEPNGTLHEGRRAVTGSDSDRGAFKTPPLRNITETGPYFHTGSAKTLADVIAHYEGNFASMPNIDPLLATPIFLSAQQRSDLEAFLRALSGATPSVSP